APPAERRAADYDRSGPPSDVRPFRILHQSSSQAKLGRVIRVKVTDLEAHLKQARITPGSLSHLYPEPLGSEKAAPRDHRSGDNPDRANPGS
ncbi:MAG: hypothetical protein M3535_09515, partial [Actinomycetota bacterium]|nr:hypothetical protein [Actinomycetota bacterium]